MVRDIALLQSGASFDACIYRVKREFEKKKKMEKILLDISPLPCYNRDIDQVVFHWSQSLKP